MVNNVKSVYTDYLFFPFLILFTISFPLPIAYNSSLTILLAILFLADIKNLKNNILVYFSKARNTLLFIIFLSLLFSIIYSEDKQLAMKGILAALPLIAIPLSLSGVDRLSLRQIDILKKVFVFSCFIISVIYLIQTTIRIGLWDGTYKLQTGPVGYQSPYLVYNLTYHQLTPSIHAVFFSLYLAFAVCILLFAFEWKTRLAKILQGLMVFYFLLYLILLTSATINFALYSFIIATISLRYSFKKIQHFLLFFGLIIIGTAITDYLLIVKYIGPDIGDIVYKFDSPSINQKIKLSFIVVILAGIAAILIKLTARRNFKLILVCLVLIVTLAGLIYLKNSNANKDNDDRKLNNISVRANYSAEAFRIIKKNWLFGVGQGDKKYKLIERNMELGDERYLEFGADAKPDGPFNAHNQFLDFWIAAGVIPVVCLLLFFINEFSKAFRGRHILYVGLVYCFCLFCVTDIALMIQRGQIFFLFFICLLEAESKKNIKAGG